MVLATGSKPAKFGWPGQDLEGVMGMYHKQDLENLEKHAPNNKVAELENLIPYERDLYVDMLIDFVEEQKANQK